MYRALIRLLTFQFEIIQILFKSKDDLILETIELRQQLATYPYCLFNSNHRAGRLQDDILRGGTKYQFPKI